MTTTNPPKAAKSPNSSKSNHNTTALADSDFPLAQYASVLGVHLILVGFTTLYLPQTTRLFTAQRMRDKPQSEFVEALTADPLLTLGWVSAGLVVVEVWWANWMRSWSFEQKAKENAVEIKLERVQFDGLRFTKLKDATLSTMITTLAIYIIMITFGAPLSTHILETALISFIVSILTAFMPTFLLGLPSLGSDTPSLINRLTWTRLFAELSPRSAIERAMVYPAAGVLVGCWLGAIPITLDWDRPWQAWPLTPLFGSIGGYILGALWALALSTVKYLAMEDLRSHPSKSKTS